VKYLPEVPLVDSLLAFGALVEALSLIPRRAAGTLAHEPVAMLLVRRMKGVFGLCSIVGNYPAALRPAYRGALLGGVQLGLLIPTVAVPRAATGGRAPEAPARPRCRRRRDSRSRRSDLSSLAVLLGCNRLA
jgi:hypothetical protein